MRCKYCGKQLDEGSVVCPRCGKSQGGEVNLPPPPVEERYTPFDESADTSHLWKYMVIGFFVPLAGIILYFMWRYKKPRTAQACLKGALVCIAVGVVVLAICLLVMCAQEPEPPQPNIPPFFE